MKTAWIIPCLAVVLGGVLGALARRGAQEKTPTPRVVEADGDGGRAARGSASLPGEVRPSWAEVLRDTAPGSTGRMAAWLLEADAAELARAWEDFQESGQSRGLTALLLTCWVARDPEAARAAMAEGKARDFWSVWARVDPEAAFAAAREESSVMAGAVLRSLGLVDPERALGFLEEYPEYTTGKVIDGIARGIARDDPGGALKFAEDYDLIRGFSQYAAYNWAEEDPEAAVDWFAERVSWTWEWDDYRAAVRGLVAERPEEIERLAERVPSGGMRKHMLEAYAESLAERDAAAARELVQRQAGAMMRQEMRETVAAQVVARDPETAMQLMRDALVDGDPALEPARIDADGQQGTRQAIGQEYGEWIRGLVEFRPAEVMELTYDSITERSYLGTGRQVATQWLRTDRVAYLEWLGGQEANAQRDAYVGSAVRLLSASRTGEYAAGLEAAELYQEESRQRRAIEDVLSSWEGAEPGEVESYFEGGNASPTAAEVYRARQERGGGQ